MEQNRITFDELWEQQERAGLQQRMMQDYPEWMHRRRIRRASLATVTVLAVAMVSLFNYQFSIQRPYDAVLCNRTTFPDSHWADVAATILTKEII